MCGGSPSELRSKSGSSNASWSPHSVNELQYFDDFMHIINIINKN